MGEHIKSAARVEMEEKRRLEVLAENQIEYLQFKPYPCQCGRGMVTTIHGCDPCAHEAAEEYVKYLNLPLR